MDFHEQKLSNKYSQKLLDTAKKIATDAIKTASKRVIQKTAEATGDLIGNKTADNKYFKMSKGIAFSKIRFRKRGWNRYTKRKRHISRKMTTNYWWIKISIRI